MGGISSERDISLQSGEAIAAALERKGHTVRRRDISPDDTSALDEQEIDVVFIALHGEFGESGEVQQLCEDSGLVYTGSSPHASLLGMDKIATKRRAEAIGVPTPQWCRVEEFSDMIERANYLEGASLPCVVKPVTGGSSVGVYICETQDEREQAVRTLLGEGEEVLVEKCIRGRELTVGILDSEPLDLLEILPSEGFYDYDAKYADGTPTQYTFEHGLDAEQVAAIQADAMKVFDALGCRDLARVDFMLDEDGNHWLLEINTIPGFTSHSLVPMAAARSGIEFDDLVDRLAHMASRRLED
jgi:D-alanine-D-alanine ligase